MTWADVAVCERCWVQREGTWEQSPHDPGLARLIELRQPFRMANPARDGEFRIENCHFCSWPTFAGIYQRVET